MAARAQNREEVVFCYNLCMHIEATIRQAIARSLGEAGVPISADEISLERPAEFAHGDYATGVALALAKRAGMSPRALAEKIVASLGEIPGVAKIDIAGPGFINFHLAPKEVNDCIAEVVASPETWGRNDSQRRKRVMIEYTDPNPFKEFHIGHLMSNAIGESIARLTEYTGAEVRRANYQGDVGPHVAKAIWGIRKLGVDPHDAAALGKAYATGAQAYESDTAAKQEIGEINAKVYDRSDAQINEIYAAGREASLKHFEEVYKILGTKFDYYFFESDTAKKGIELVRGHPEVFEKSDGALVYKGEKVGLHTRVFITSKGLPTYETKDLGLAEMKAEVWPFDSSITVTAHEQAGYFQVMLAAMKEISPDIAAKIKHVSHGMMRLASGKMSSRTGDVITGESLLAELTEAAKARATESRADDPAALAQQVAVAAIKYQILKQGSGKDIIFDRERALSLEGDSGPYLQYAHARAAQVVERARTEGVVAKIDEHAEPIELTRLLVHFPEAVAYAVRELEPHLLTNYLIELAGAFNSWYAQVHILDGTPEASHKVAIADAVRATLKNGLWLLGIPTPSKM